MANLTISERAYQTLQELAEAEGKTSEDLLDTLLEAVIEPQADLLQRLGRVAREKRGTLYNPATDGASMKPMTGCGTWGPPKSRFVVQSRRL